MPPHRPYIAAVLLLGLTLATSPARAQQPAAAAAPDLDRIRRQFAQTGDSIFLGPLRSDYKIVIEEQPEDLDYRFRWLYDQATVTPGYVRPWYPIYHHEMLSIMIPQEFRAHLYPIGVPVGNTWSAIKDAFRARDARAAKARVAAEVKALEQGLERR